jgi:hypothetical protein
MTILQYMYNVQCTVHDLSLLCTVPCKYFTYEVTLSNLAEQCKQLRGQKDPASIAFCTCLSNLSFIP